MASETVLSDDHSTAPEEVDKEVGSGVKKMEPENVSPLKESAENSKKSEELKIEEKQIDPPEVEVVKEINEKPKADDSGELAAPLPESTEQKIEDKPIAPILEASDKDIVEVGKETVPESETTSILEPSVYKTDCKSEEKSAAGPARKREESNVEPEKIVDVPESSLAAVVEEKLEKVEELPAKVVEATEAKVVKVSETGYRGEETSEPAPVVEEKPPEQSEVAEQIEKEIPTYMADDTKEPAKEEIIVIESSDQVKSESPESQVEEKDVECSTTDEVPEKTDKGIEEKESAKETVEIEGLSQEKVVEPVKIEEKTEIPEAKTEQKSVVVAEELAQCEEKPIQDATSSIPPTEVAEKAAEKEVTSRDTELVADEVKKKGETVANDAEKKIEETVQEVAEAKLYQEDKQVDEAAKTDIQDSESTKDCEDTKTSQDAPKEDVPVKTQKQSNNIIKMVKQSLVKAKKAIIGKSQNSKTPASEPKDEFKK